MFTIIVQTNLVLCPPLLSHGTVSGCVLLIPGSHSWTLIPKIFSSLFFTVSPKEAKGGWLDMSDHCHLAADCPSASGRKPHHQIPAHVFVQSKQENLQNYAISTYNVVLLSAKPCL